MKNENNIEKIFQDGFENYQPDVNPDLWNSIESQIDSGGNATPPSDGGNTSIVQTLVKSTQFWVATTIITVAVVSTIVVVNSLKEDQNNSQETQSAQSQNIENKNTNHTTPQQDSQKEPGELDQPVVKDTDNNSSETSDSPGSTSPVENTESTPSSENDASEGNSADLEADEKEALPEQTSEQPEENSAKTENKDPVVPEENNEPTHTIDLKRSIVSTTDRYAVGDQATFKLDNTTQVKRIDWYLNGKLITNASSVEIELKEEGGQLLEAEVAFTNGEEMVYEHDVTVEACSYLGQFEPGSMKKGLGKIPNTFSPNRDGKNDFFSIDSKNISSFNIIIFDSKGNMVYGSEKPDFKWDGMDRSGKPLDEKQFRYSIRAVGKDGQRYQTEGQLIIYR